MNTSELTAFIRSRRSAVERLALTALLAYFAGRLLFFSLVIHPAVPPDEVTHIGIIRHFSQYVLLPPDTPRSWEFGPVTHVPYLYYFLFGKLLALLPAHSWDLQLCRIISAVLCFFMVIFTWRLARLVAGKHIWVSLLTVAALTNTPMFSFLGASVNYDNLANCCAAAALFYWSRLLQVGNHRQDSLKLLIAAAAGALTKVTLVPFCVFLYGILGLHWRLTGGPVTARKMGTAFVAYGAENKALLVVTAAVVALAAHLYVSNLIKFRALVPSEDQVLTEAQNLNNRIYARNKIALEFKADRVSFEQAMRATSIIRHEQDRHTTVALIERIRAWKEDRRRVLDPVSYIPIWFSLMLNRTMAITGHLIMPLTPFFSGFFLLLAAAALVAAVRMWQPRCEPAAINALLALTLAYAGLLCAFNYETLKTFLDAGIGLQGRYIFPVIGPAWILAWLFMSRVNLPYCKAPAALSICAGLIAGDFPYFLLNAGPNWYMR